MGRALQRRPNFWTVPKVFTAHPAKPAKKRLRLEFGDTKTEGGFALTYADSRLLATQTPTP